MVATAETAVMEAAATERHAQTGEQPVPPRRRRRAGAAGPDRASVILFSLASFLAVLALLAWQVRASPSGTAARSVTVLRRIYQTTVVETIRGPGSGTSVSQSVSSSGSGSVPVAAPTTRSSPAH
jgi:hypothetical protein